MNIRHDISGFTPQDLNKLNENTMQIWQKVYGDIDFADGNTGMKDKIMTQWIPVQGEGNLDSSYPLEIRFFIPPNVKKLKSALFNVRSEPYRMDSSVAKGGGAVKDVEIAMSMSSANTGIASFSSETVGVTSFSSNNAIIGTSLESTSQTSLVHDWGNWDENGERPGNGIQVQTNSSYTLVYDKMLGAGNGDGYADGEPVDVLPLNTPYWKHISGSNIKFATVYNARYNNPNVGTKPLLMLDLAQIQHRHNMSHTHKFTLSQSPHAHSVQLSPHMHDIELKPHTHEAVGKLNLEPHEHQLNEGIKISTTMPENLEVFVNSVKVGRTLNGIDSFTNEDIVEKIVTGEWNVIKVSTSNLARVVLYGIIELVNKY